MDEPTPTKDDQAAARDDLLRRVDAFAAGHDLRDATLIKLFTAYLQEAQGRFGPAGSR